MIGEIDDARSFFEEARAQRVCAECGRATRDWEAHHVIQKQRCRREGAPLHSTRNTLRLCAKRPDACHERHTTHARLVALAALTDDNIAFAAEYLEPGPAYEYLVRYYRGSDPRVDQLLRQAA